MDDTPRLFRRHRFPVLAPPLHGRRGGEDRIGSPALRRCDSWPNMQTSPVRV
jgi:hypothetical protein